MTQYIEIFDTLPLFLLEVGLFGLSVGAIAFLQRFFGKGGLYAYMGVAMIIASIQVIKLTDIPLYDNPIPMGTTIFASLFLCNDLINERYGRTAALKGIWLSFILYGFFSLLMYLTLYFPTASDYPAPQDALWTLFAPSATLWAAGMTSYVASQYYGTWVFSTISRLTHRQALWLRAALSLVIASLIDNTLFSWLAWRFLASDPVTWPVLWWTYIWGTLGIRCILSFISIPALYGLAKISPPQESCS